MASFSPVDRKAALAAGAAAVLLFAAAVAMLVRPAAVELVTGLRGSPVVSAPDDLPPLSKNDETPFFQVRNQLEVRVAEATTLRLFLDRNRLNKPFHRRQIVEQLGNDSPDAPIAAGMVFRIALTPVAGDVPGAAPVQGK